MAWHLTNRCSGHHLLLFGAVGLARGLSCSAAPWKLSASGGAAELPGVRGRWQLVVRSVRFSLSALALAAVSVACTTEAPILEEIAAPEGTKGRANDSPVAVSVSRTACFGLCPEYSVTIYGNGDVWYTGTRHVAVSGVMRNRVQMQDVLALYRALQTSGFFGFEESYCLCAADCSETHLRLEATNESKTVRSSHRAFCQDEADMKRVEQLYALASKIDDVSGAAFWVGAEEADDDAV